MDQLKVMRFQESFDLEYFVKRNAYAFRFAECLAIWALVRGHLVLIIFWPVAAYKAGAILWMGEDAPFFAVIFPAISSTCLF